jgi:hypothetical protein
MPLGKQFKNTFFEGAKGAVFHTDLNTLKDADELPSEQRRKPHIDDKGAPGVAYQGMLMDPYAYTGHRNDPTIPEEERRAVVRKSAQIGVTTDDPIESRYAGNKKHYVNNDVPSKKRPEYDQAIEDAGYESGIPTHMFKNDVDVPVIVKKSLGRTVAGDYNSAHSRAIRVAENRFPKRTEISSEKVTKARTTPGKHMINPQGIDMLKKDYSKVDSSQWGEDSSGSWNSLKRLISSNGLVKTHTGETSSEDLDNLPEGHGVTLFPGKGEETEGYTAHPVKIPMGWTNGGRRSFKTYHRRLEKIPTGETYTFTDTKYKETPAISGATLVHEIGHSIDPNVHDEGGRNPGGRSTVNEAVADGFEDRFHTHKDNYEDALHPSPERAQEIRRQGYGTNFKGLTDTDLNRATYAAVRQHVSMGDNNFRDIEARSNLMRAATGRGMYDTEATAHGNSLLLGHLYTRHAHVRDILGHLGLTHVGEAAAEQYRSKITDAGKTPNYQDSIQKGQTPNLLNRKAFKQEAFPGME